MREINILGLNLRDYSLREKMRLSDAYLRDGALNTIEFISARMLMQAERDAQQKQWLEEMDLIVYCDPDIVHAGGITSRSRLKEIENNSFWKEFLKKLMREKKTVYLLTDSEEQMRLLEEGLASLQAVLRTAGKRILPTEQTDGTIDDLINDMNDKAPNVILALMEYPKQEALIHQNRSRINADVWAGLQADCFRFKEQEKGLGGLIWKLQKRLFRRKVHQYENQEKAEE